MNQQTRERDVARQQANEYAAGALQCACCGVRPNAEGSDCCDPCDEEAAELSREVAESWPGGYADQAMVLAEGK